MELEEVSVVEGVSGEAFGRLFAGRRRPVVIRGGLPAGLSLEDWAPRRLAEAYGEARVEAYVMKDGRIELDEEVGFRIESLTLGEYVEETLRTDSPRLYLRTKLPGPLPALDRRLPTPVYCEGGLSLRRNLWFSAAGTVSQLHFDLPHNLVAVLHGEKRFHLFPQREGKSLYRHGWLSSTPHLARVDPEAPDYARYPRLRQARGQATTLGPGDLLYIPPRHWHHARSLTPCVSVNFWWSGLGTYPLLRASDAYKRVRGLNI